VASRGSRNGVLTRFPAAIGRIRPPIGRISILLLHHIFLPADYPPDWAITEHRDWNEQYLLQALLLDAQRWQVEIGAHGAFLRLKTELAATLQMAPAQVPGGAAFWFRRVG
jgi:hypothetical protein